MRLMASVALKELTCTVGAVTKNLQLCSSCYEWLEADMYRVGQYCQQCLIMRGMDHGHCIRPD